MKNEVLIAQMRNYCQSTKIPRALQSRYDADTLQLAALYHLPDRCEALAIAFCYGRAKGYRAAKAEQKGRRKEAASNDE